MITINNVYRLLGLGILRLTCSAERVVKHLCPKGLNIGTRTGVIKKPLCRGPWGVVGWGALEVPKTQNRTIFLWKLLSSIFL